MYILGVGTNHHCNVCGKNFKRRDNFRLHQSVHERGFDCTICKKPHTSQKNVDVHVQRLHRPNVTGNNFKNQLFLTNILSDIQ